MIDEILSFLRFATDPKTRETISTISQVVSASNRDWEKEIQTRKAKFACEESYKVGAFVNHLLDEMKNSGVSPEKITKFRIVFTELIGNAFQHGCKNSHGGKIRIRCTYSRWFIRLEIADPGRGFNLSETLQKQLEADTGEKVQHGLTLVNNLTYALRTNKRGNVVTAFLASQDSMDIVPAVEKYKGQEILVVTVTDRQEWQYLMASWEPLLHAVENTRQDLVLIRFQDMSLTTDRVRKMEKYVVRELNEHFGKRYALVVSSEDERYFELSKFNSDNFRVFDELQTDEARQWLIGTIKYRHEKPE